MDRARFAPSVICIGKEGKLFGALPAAGIDARALNLGGKRNGVRALVKLVSSMWRARPDVVVVWGYNAEMLGRIAARVTGVKRSVVWVHNIGDIEPRSKLRSLADRALTRWTSGYFGVAEAQRRYMVNDLCFPDDKIRIIHNGVDPALFDFHDERSVLAEFGIEAHDPVVGIVAGLRPEKDHVTFLHAARIVLDDVPEAKFLVIGDGEKRADLEALCRELKIAPNVLFAGERSDVAQLLRGMDVFTMSSATVECFPIALLEAMACGRPAVCTDVGGISEMVRHGESGYLVATRDPRQLAARLKELLSQPDVARRMGRAGRNRVELEFTLERSVAAAERAIEDVAYGRDLSRESAG
jgi:glycosyltransferase involved in cell wall biosynthesis